MTSQWLLGVVRQSGHLTQCIKWSCFAIWAAARRFPTFRLTTSLKSVLCYHDSIEIDATFSVVSVTPQTPKFHHKLGGLCLSYGDIWESAVCVTQPMCTSITDWVNPWSGLILYFYLYLPIINTLASWLITMKDILVIFRNLKFQFHLLHTRPCH